MRGKDQIELEKEKIKRITPAYAGKSLILFIFQNVIKDHPRLCGEKIARSYYVVNT